MLSTGATCKRTRFASVSQQFEQKGPPVRAADETLARLHQKCYLSAMRAFRALLPELKAESFTRISKICRSARTIRAPHSRTRTPQHESTVGTVRLHPAGSFTRQLSP